MTQAEPGEGRGAGNDPIPGERREAVARDILDEGADDHERDDEANDEANRDGPEANAACAAEKLVAVLDQLERGRAEHRWDSEEEAELCRGAPFHAEAEPTHDRRARTADPGNHRQALHEADAERRRDGQFRHPDDVTSLRKCFNRQYSDATDEERDRYHISIREHRPDMRDQD